ncbi:MAG: DUF4190 domain-containing protein [Planctomycetes bacterium]|nr:DUF4190 domain-containing protein [Planctomycetota bacterium]
MARYFIETTAGRKGPFPPDAIARGIKQGKIPLGAKLYEEGTERPLKAAEVAHLAQSAPTASSPEPTASAPASSAGGFQPVEPYRAQAQSQQPVAGPRPAQPSQYPQYPVPQRAAQPYPQYPQYPQQSSYPYPGNAQAGAYPQAYPQAYPNYQQPYGGQPQAYYPTSGGTSGLAVASLIVSLTSLLVCGPLCIIGIVLGVMALRETQPNGPKTGRGLAIAGIVSGVVILALFAVIVLYFVAEGS